MVMTFGVLTANAVTNAPRGSFDELSSVTKFNVEVDWSQLSINGLTPEEWVRFRNAEQPQYDAEEELERELKMRWVEMITEANDKLNKKHYYLFADDEYIYDYTLVVQPIHIDKKGNQLVLCIIKHEADDREVVRFSVNGRGGVFGTMSNLWGDGFRSSGKAMAKMLIKYLPKKK